MNMKITKKEENHIKNQFQKISSKEDFLELLNYSKNIIYKKKTIPFTLKQLNYYINKERIDTIEYNKNNSSSYKSKFYNRFYINKKNGTKRGLDSPVKGLKEIQKSLNIILQVIHNPNKNSYGFIMDKNICDNAINHVNKNFVFNIDLKDFFPSIHAKRVYSRLLYKPFNLGDSKERKKISNIIKTLCCHPLLIKGEINNCLPQGAPTSPTLSNIVSDKLDFLLTGVAKRFGLSYSRYADDITFSSHHCTFFNGKNDENIYNEESTFRKEIARIITDQGLHINNKKVRLQKKGFKQEVTGLIVNQKVNVKRSYIKEIRLYLHFWEKYGYDSGKNLFAKRYADKRHGLDSSLKIPEFEYVIDGKLLFLEMIKGKDNSTAKTLRNRYNDLIHKKENKELLIAMKKGANFKRKIDSLSKDHIKSSLSVETSKDLTDLIKKEVITKSKIPENLTTLRKKGSIDKNQQTLDDIFELGLDKAMEKLKL